MARPSLGASPRCPPPHSRRSTRFSSTATPSPEIVGINASKSGLARQLLATDVSRRSPASELGHLDYRSCGSTGVAAVRLTLNELHFKRQQGEREGGEMPHETLSTFRGEGDAGFELMCYRKYFSRLLYSRRDVTREGFFFLQEDGTLSPLHFQTISTATAGC